MWWSVLKYVRIMRIFHATQTHWGAVQTALVLVDLDVYVSPTSTNGARCGDRWSYHSGTRAVNIGRRGQGCFKWAGNSYKQSFRIACCDVTKAGIVARPWGARSPWVEGCYKKSPDLAKPLKTADIVCKNTQCRFQLTWPQPFEV